MKKNIWILNHYASDTFHDRGGRHYSLAKYLQRAGYSPVIFCANAKHGAPECYFDDDSLWHEHLAEEIDVPYVFIRTRTYVGNGKQRIFNMMDYFLNVKKAAAEYAKKNGKPEVIYASSVHPLTLVAGIQLAKKFGVKCICEVRDLWPESLVVYGIAGPRNPAVILLRWLEKWIYKKADSLIFTMEGAYDYIAEQGWEKAVPRSKVHYINNGVDLEVFRSNQQNCTVADEDLDNPDLLKVGYAGSIREANKVGMLLDMAKTVSDPKVRFLIWGAGDEEAMLRQRVIDEKITNVVFKGYVEKKYVPYIAGRMDINYVDPFDEEIAKYGISSNKLFDYLAAGKPILMGFAGKHNPAEPFGCAVVREPNALALGEGLRQLIHMPAGAYQKMCAGAQQAAEKYSFASLTEMLIAVIEG